MNMHPLIRETAFMPPPVYHYERSAHIVWQELVMLGPGKCRHRTVRG